MPWHRILNVFALEETVWAHWPEFGANQFMAQGHDRIRLETQNRLPDHGIGPASHTHERADTVHVILEGEGEYVLAPDVWVPARAGDIFLTRGGEVHGGRGTNPDKPLKYLVLEGPAPVDITVTGIPNFTNSWGVEDVGDGTELQVGFNGGIPGTNVLLGGPNDRPKWMDQLPPDSYTD